MLNCIFNTQLISIHTLTKRATAFYVQFYSGVEFQFTLSRRERRLVLIMWLAMCNFNSHSHEESDIYRNICIITIMDFNSHSHEESDCIILLAFERIIPDINFSRLNFFYCTYSIKLKKRLNEVRTSYINYNSLYFALIYQNCLALMILVGFSQY